MTILPLHSTKEAAVKHAEEIIESRREISMPHLEDGAIAWPAGHDEEAIRDHLKEDHGYNTDAAIDEDVSYVGESPFVLHKTQHTPFFAQAQTHKHTDMQKRHPMAVGGIIEGYDEGRLNHLRAELEDAVASGNEYAQANIRHAIDAIENSLHLAEGGYVEPIMEPVMADEGIALVEEIGPGVDAVIGEAGPEAVIPLDDPEAVEVMADAIAEGTGENPSSEPEAVAEAAEAVAEAAEAVAEAAEEIAEENAEIAEVAIEAIAEVAEEAVEESGEATEEVAEVAEVAVEEIPEVVEEVEAEAIVEEVAESRDRAPRDSHWSNRPLFGKRRAS
jgi:hypothetical protein